MDNDNQVGREVVRVKDLFLTETFGSQIRPPKLYSVEDEFAKAKKNRSSIVTVTIFAFIILSVVAAAVTTLLIQRSAQQVDFDIADFQNVNLTEILDVQNRNENALETLLRELADLEAQKATRVEEVRSDMAGRIEFVNNENLTIAERNNRISNLRSEEVAFLAEIDREFDPLIEAKREEIAILQARIDEYDTRIIQEAKRNEEILNNQQQLFEFERLKLTDYYETKIGEIEAQANKDKAELVKQKDELVALLRRNHAAELNWQFNLYNPIFEEPAIAAILDRNLVAPTNDLSMLPPYNTLLDAESILTRRSFDRLRSALYDFETVLSRVELVPYKNSVPETFRTLRELETIIITEYERLWTTLISNISAKKDVITQQSGMIEDLSNLLARYEYAVDNLAEVSRENGYVVDARDTTNLLVRINTSLPPRDDSIGYVFRDVDDFIGTIRLRQNGAELVELADANRPIQPFDIFLIQLQ